MTQQAPPRIYLDNAATSWPKPEAVYAAVDRYQRECGVAIGRGATRQAAAAQRIIDRCRDRAAQLLGAASPRSIVFTFNGTDALNLALHGLLRPGDHVVTTVLEHNSVLRPLAALRDRRGVETTYVPAGGGGVIDPREIERAITPRTVLVTVLHVSNVTGAIQPVEEAARVAHKHGALFLLDAAQSVGHLPFDVVEVDADLLACSGHKGLLGPLGTGLLYIRPGIEAHLDSLRQGGTGSQSESDLQPETMPDKFEAGNHNAPGLAGLEAAFGWIETQGGVAALRRHEVETMEPLLAGLRELTGVRVHGPENARARTGVVSLSLDGFAPHEAAAVLDDQFGIESRAGLHCAPGAHRALGTLAAGGTLRLSLGPFVTPGQIDATLQALRALAAG